MHSKHDQKYTASYLLDQSLALTCTRNAHSWIFKNPSLLYEGKQCEISWGENTGYATLDEYGSLSVKYWASLAEERKNFVFIKVPKTLREIVDVRTLRPILASLYVKN
jgi:hypothetical protein